MKNRILILSLFLSIFTILLVISCNQGNTNNTYYQNQSVIDTGIVTDIQIETVYKDESNDNAVTGAVIGGIGSYLLSSRPSFTKVAIGAVASAGVGKMTGGQVSSYNQYTIIVEDIEYEGTIEFITKSNKYKIGDSVLHNNDNIIKKL